MERRRSLITQPVTFFMCVASHADTPTAAGMTGLCRPDKVDIDTGLLKVWLSPGLMSETMAEINERPIILPYSNPTSRSEERLAERHIRRLAPLAFLSPKIIQAIADGSAPTGLTVSSLTQAPPHAWTAQEHMLGRKNDNVSTAND